VLILGGSLGARTINETLWNNLDHIPGDIQFLWQTGKLYFDKALHYVNRKNLPNIKVLPFISEMNLAYGCADVIVSRAGAGTISELAVAGKPVILIPSPNVAEDHQMKNALSLTQQNAAMLVKDSEAGDKLIKMVIDLVNNKDMGRIMSENIKKMAIPDAAEKIAGEILKYLEIDKC